MEVGRGRKIPGRADMRRRVLPRSGGGFKYLCAAAYRHILHDWLPTNKK